jgi:hypothetical protein
MHKLLAALVVLAALHAAAASSSTLPCPPPGGDPAYQVSLRSLTGPAGADLTVRVKRAPESGCAIPDALKMVQVKIFALDGTLLSTKNLDDVTASDGTTDLRLGKVARQQRVATEVLVQNADATRTYVLQASTRTLLRPDLVVKATTAPRVVFATRTFDVTAQVAELNGDVGTAATVTLSDGPLALGSAPVTVDAGGTADVHFQNVALADSGPSTLALAVRDADPGETDVANNGRRAGIDVINVANHSDVDQASLGGYGAQMNQNVYASITGAPFSALADLESKVIAQQPGLVRIFFNDVQARDFPDRLDSFYKTLQLAQKAGAIINVTLQSTGSLTVGPATTRLVNVLNTAVKTHGISNLRWLTIQNEPNGALKSDGTPSFVPADIEPWYRMMDTKLRALGLRTQIHFMGLDLVATNQQTWFDYAATHMSDILDAYSIHVFWDYWDTAKLEQRLEDVRAIVDAEPAHKPIYSMEYGVRGIKTIGTTKFVDPGVWDATQQIPITQTNVNAFQQAWFDVLAAQLGFAGTVKWDSYYGKYDNTPQAYYMLGQWDENGIWRVNPIYNVVRLFTQVTRPGWNVTGVEQDSILDTRLAASYAGPNGELTVVGLDRAGGQLNGLSTTLVPYAIGGLPPATTFQLVEWNRDGDGSTADAETITTDDAGVASFVVPQQAVFALTNV